MGTTIQKLNEVLESKNAIKTALINKGVEVSDVMGEYAEAIDNLELGITPTGTLEITENGTYDVTEYAGVNANIQGGSGIEGGYNVTFKINDEIYQIISVKAGEKIYAPPNEPTTILASGYVENWVDTDSNVITFPYTPSADIGLSAVVVSTWIFGVLSLIHI